jgi:hypothetical protein
MVGADSGKRRLFFSDFDKAAIDCRIPIGRCSTRETSSFGLAGTSRTEPQRDHRPFVLGDGAQHLPDHLSRGVGRIVGQVLRFRIGR